MYNIPEGNEVGRSSIYQNVSIFIRSNSGILHIAIFTYYLHKCRATLLYWKY